MVATPMQNLHEHQTMFVLVTLRFFIFYFSCKNVLGAYVNRLVEHLDNSLFLRNSLHIRGKKYGLVHILQVQGG
jgi:hypothetical protein